MSINRVIISGNLTRDPELRSDGRRNAGSGRSASRSTTAVATRRRASGKTTRTSSTARCSVLAPRALSRYPVQGHQGRHRRQASLEPVGARRAEAQQDRGDRRRAGVHDQPQRRLRSAPVRARPGEPVRSGSKPVRFRAAGSAPSPTPLLRSTPRPPSMTKTFRSKRNERGFTNGRICEAASS